MGRRIDQISRPSVMNICGIANRNSLKCIAVIVTGNVKPSVETEWPPKFKRIGKPGIIRSWRHRLYSQYLITFRGNAWGYQRIVPAGGNCLGSSGQPSEAESEIVVEE